MSVITTVEALSVAISEIEIPARIRKPDPEKVVELSCSIEADGLLQPIGLRKGTTMPYILVFGGLRLESFRELKRTTIEARLLRFDEEEAEAAALAENLFRRPLSGAEYIGSIKRWGEIHARKHPESVGVAAKSAGGKEGARRRGLMKTGEGLPGPINAPPGGTPPPEAPTAARFDLVAAAAMNVSASKVRQDARSAKSLSEADLEVLGCREVNLSDIHRIASIKDEQVRRHAVSLVGSGMDPRAAVAFVTAPATATIEAEAGMNDEEWLEHDCKDALGRLSHQVSFRQDAIVWRKSVAPLGDFREKMRQILQESQAWRTAPFQLGVASLVEVLHPNDWPKCGPCDGTGRTEAGSECTTCRGHGYSIRSR